MLPQLLLQFRQRQVRLLLQPTAQLLPDRLSEFGLAPGMMRDAFHLPGAQLLPTNLFYVTHTDPKPHGQLFLRALSLLVGLQNPTPQIVRVRVGHRGCCGVIANHTLAPILSLHY